MRNLQKVCVVGLGYIGLPTAAILAQSGHQVVGYDTNELAVSTINKGLIHIVEPGLGEIVKDQVSAGRLMAASEPVLADTFIIAVPTPINEENSPDLSFVEAAIRKIINVIAPGNLIIIESTIPVGTTAAMATLIRQMKGTDFNFQIAHCPERVLPGNIIHEIKENDRIIGANDKVSETKAADFYGTFVLGQLHTTDCATAELCKLTENSYRDLNIAFANQLSMYCEEVGVDVFGLINLANKHPRVDILNPGVGVGGHCIAVDPWFLIKALPEKSKLSECARLINLEKTVWVADTIISDAENFRKKHGRAPVIGCLGITFKPNIDDIRESPALDIVKRLCKLGHNILVWEPNLQQLNGLVLSSSKELFYESDLVYCLVSHEEFIGDNLKITRDFTGAAIYE